MEIVMKNLSIAASVMLFLFMGGCYESRFPLGPPEGGTIDPLLPGFWRCLQKEKESKPFVMTIIPFDERQYYSMIATEGEKPVHYRAHSTDVKGTPILNIQEIDSSASSDKRRWIFSRYTLLRPDVLQLEIVRDDAFKGIEPSPSSVVEVVERNIQNQVFYNDFCTCVRSAEKRQ